MSATRCQTLRASLGWRLSGHARRAARARGFSVEDVLLACVDPQVSYTAFDYGPDRFVHQRGHVAVVVSPGTRTVITVLLRSREHWTDADALHVTHGPR